MTQWMVHEPPAFNTQTLCILLIQCICVIHVTLTTDSKQAYVYTTFSCSSKLGHSVFSVMYKLTIYDSDPFSH